MYEIDFKLKLEDPDIADNAMVHCHCSILHSVTEQLIINIQRCIYIGETWNYVIQINCKKQTD